MNPSAFFYHGDAHGKLTNMVASNADSVYPHGTTTFFPSSADDLDYLSFDDNGKGVWYTVNPKVIKEDRRRTMNPKSQDDHPRPTFKVMNYRASNHKKTRDVAPSNDW